MIRGGCGLVGGDAEEEAKKAGERTCSLVRSGVAAFNEEDYDVTVQKFRDAIEPAKDYAALSDEVLADDLLEAVRYYADLPTDQYRRAFETSPEFKKYQVITLGQCGDAEPDDSPEQESET